MSLFDKILGRKAAPAAEPAKLAPTVAPADASPPPKPAPSVRPPIKRVYDAYGRSFDIPREQWRSRFLPNNVKAQWDSADGLARVIEEALQDGFPEDCIEPLKRLREIESRPRRAAVLEGAALLQLNRFDAAREVLDGARRKDGEDATILVGLARAEGGLGRRQERDQLLWRALELEPNHDQAMQWYVALHSESGDQAAGQQALTRIAGLPGSWRAQLHLARIALEEKRVDDALGLYRDALARAAPAPGDMLHHISGDLGKHGQVQSAIDLVLPHYQVGQHGLNAGNNLLKAYLDLGQWPRARDLLEELYALNRAEWRGLLNYWDVEVSRAENVANSPSAEPSPDVFLHRYDDPVWSRERLAFDLLLPPKSGQAPRLVFVCGSARLQDTKGETTTQTVNAAGVVARGLPLYLAEQAFLRMAAAVTYLQPMQPHRGLLLASEPWGTALIQSDQMPNSHFVFMHIDASVRPWKLDFSIVEGAAKTTLQQWQESFDVENSVPDVLRIERELLRRLQQVTGVDVNELSGALRPPDDAWLPSYIHASEQTMALRSAGLRSDDKGFRLSERAVVDTLLNHVLQQPGNARSLLLLLSTMDRIVESAPAVAAEYHGKLERLGKDLKIQGELSETIQDAMNGVLANISASHT